MNLERELHERKLLNIKEDLIVNLMYFKEVQKEQSNEADTLMAKSDWFPFMNASRAMRNTMKMVERLESLFPVMDILLEDVKKMAENDIINSDSPEALTLLEERLSELKANHERMEEANKYYNEHNTMQGFKDFTYEKAKEVDELIEGLFFKIPFDYSQLAISRQCIKSVENRIEEIKFSRKNIENKDMAEKL